MFLFSFKLRNEVLPRNHDVPASGKLDLVSISLSFNKSRQFIILKQFSIFFKHSSFSELLKMFYELILRSHAQFTSAVKRRMLLPPFNDFLDKTSVRLLTLRREAAYLVKSSFCIIKINYFNVFSFLFTTDWIHFFWISCFKGLLSLLNEYFQEPNLFATTTPRKTKPKLS